MAQVKLTSITKTFGSVTALDNIDLEVKDKEFFVLLGPTGAGKTTMLRLVAGLEKPDKGDVLLDGESVAHLIPAMRDVAFVFQYYTLYPTYTVRQNLEFPLRSKLRNYPQEEIDQRVAEAARVLHIERLLDRDTTTLSGGEMQRVAIGRAIVRTPRVFLMDEPLSNLDAKLREEMRAELAHLHHDLGSTFFYVTHDQVEAMTMGDRIGVLNLGVIQQVGTPEQIYNRPQNTFVAKFVGSPAINLLEGEIEGDTLRIGRESVACTLSAEQRAALQAAGSKRAILGIRPEDIEVSRSEAKGACNVFECTIYFKQSMGAEDILNLRLGEVVLRAVAPPSLRTKVGEVVYVSLNMDRAHLFDPETEKRIGA
ncbi:MAG: ABC transporter ATP-binding protein [Spirochaetales bacterium]|nr:ABC transporter ATP-binding protein [Spirochaetales bacterium]